jgi:predicted kinase
VTDGPLRLARVPIPCAPDFRIDWTAVTAESEWLTELDGCPQDSAFHAEGDVLVHTRMVAEALVALPGWRAKPAGERAELFLASLLHDVAKPATTVTAEGRVRSPGHAVRGALRARHVLWQRGVEPGARERIAWLVRLHLAPFHAIEREDPQRVAIKASIVAGCEQLALLAEADARGRTSDTAAGLLDAVELFRALADDAGCLGGPYPFANDHSRFAYFRTPGRDPAYRAYQKARSTVTLMSGLPGSGKDTWLAEHAPHLGLVSLDAIRAAMRISPSASQASVVGVARDRARELLRLGRDFAWNATNVTTFTRTPIIDLLADYGAHVRIVSLEASPETLARRNSTRDRPVPDPVLKRLAARWEPPTRLEAHAVETVLT